MQDLWTRSPAVVIAFPDSAERPQRPLPSAGEPRGEILLFTGVRYERLDVSSHRPGTGPKRAKGK